MPKTSAGLLVYRSAAAGLEVLLVHPGGPYWERRDDGAWSLPKGEYDAGEDPAQAAIREFREELGVDPPRGPSVFLGELRQGGGKRVAIWALEGDVDVSDVRSNTFTLEWPPRSGRMQAFPEIDRAQWFRLDGARRKLLSGQIGFLDRLTALLEP